MYGALLLQRLRQKDPAAGSGGAAVSTLGSLDTGSGRKIPVICDGNGERLGVFTTESQQWEWADSL